MEVQHEVQRIHDHVAITTGTVQGAASGALAGGVWGAVAGAVLSAAAGTADMFFNEKLRNEAMDYTKDLFGYQLQNIQALPYTLTKVSAFNNNNKIFPILECYSCTDLEKQALAHKIAYNGMSVGVIGKMRDYIENDWSYENIKSQGYIKGQLIRLETVNDDYHIVNAIAGELNKGIYIKG